MPGIFQKLEALGLGRTRAQLALTRAVPAILSAGTAVGFLIGTTSNPTVLEILGHVVVGSGLGLVAGGGVNHRLTAARLTREKMETVATVAAERDVAQTEAASKQEAYARLVLGIENAGQTLAQFIDDSELRLDASTTFCRLLGEGGMAKALLVYNSQLEAFKVWKVPQPDLLTNVEGLHRFKSEARAMLSVEHPGVVRFFNLGQIPRSLYLDVLRKCNSEEYNDYRTNPQFIPDNVPYIDMEHIEGQTLTDHLLAYPGKRLPLNQALNFAYMMGKTLREVSAKGIIHRDMKPDNVFVVNINGSGEVRTKIGDFGLAKREVMSGSGKSAQRRMTKTGMIMGTPQYMAPEQCRAGDMDWRVDQYALGVILYEMIVGSLPFGDEGVDSTNANTYLMKVLTAEPKNIRTWPGLDVPEYIAVVVHRMFARDAEHRYQSWHDCLTALYDAIDYYATQHSTPTFASTPGSRS